MQMDPWWLLKCINVVQSFKLPLQNIMIFEITFCTKILTSGIRATFAWMLRFFFIWKILGFWKPWVIFELAWRSSCMVSLATFLFIIVILCDQNLHAFFVIKVALEKQSVNLFLEYVNDVYNRAKTPYDDGCVVIFKWL